ncbi:MAG: hypothetical protein NVV67_17105 [Pseudoxanthomonas sp.]|nr:hypothetical protein [Pseudoxanthomonas sp.]
MAKKVAADIFEVFGWELVLPADQNWDCVDKGHLVSKHPTDVVFRYEHPYRACTVHLNVDLKSYARGSITGAAIQGALISLAKATACAGLSVDWQKLYALPDTTLDVAGLLFVYNHDGAYDKDFSMLLSGADPEKVAINPRTTLHVMSPQQIAYLATVANDINGLRGKKAIPFAGDQFWFYYPDLIGEHARTVQPKSAAIETLQGPVIVCRYIMPDTKAGSGDAALVYYNRQGDTTDEFKYLIDYLFRYQLLMHCEEITIRMPAASSAAPAIFKRALEAYAAEYYQSDELQSRLSKIKIEVVTNVVTQFSQVELGMERATS